MGYAFKNEAGKFISGTINKDDLTQSMLNKITSHLSKQNWTSGEQPIDGIAAPELDGIFSVISQASNEHISRSLTLLDMESREGQLTYRSFDEAPALAKLCRFYKKSETVFNRCLDLLSQNKEKDNLPNVYINGVDINHPGYHFLKLPYDDPRALLLGDITNCCQSIGGYSQQCVIDGWRLVDRGFYILVKDKKQRKNPSVTELLDSTEAEIIGQGYAWLSAFGNLVFDSWENLRPEADNSIAVKMLYEFGQRIVSKRLSNVLRVTIGTGGKTPSELRKKNSDKPEIMAQGYQHSDSLYQAEIAIIDINDTEWNQTIDDALSSTSLTESEKTELKNNAPMSIQYPDMLRNYLSKEPFHHWISSALEKRTLASSQLLNKLMLIYVMVQNNTDNIMDVVKLLDANYNKETAQACAAAGDYVMYQGNFPLPKNLIKLFQVAFAIMNSKTTLNASPVLFEPLKSALAHLNATQLQKVISSNTDHILHDIAIYPELLTASLNLYPEDKRLSAIYEKNSYGRTVLFQATIAPESMKTILALLPTDKILATFYEKDNYGNTPLHCVANNTESIKTILALLPQENRLAAVCKKNNQGATVLNIAYSTPESFKTILELLPKEHRLAAVCEKNNQGETVLNNAYSTPESLKTILAILPAEQRLAAVWEKNNNGATVLHCAASKPESLKTILALLPEDKRLTAVFEITQHVETVINLAISKPESLKTILKLLPEDKLLAALCAKKKETGSALHHLINNPEYLKTILTLLPEDKRIAALCVQRHYGGATVMHEAITKPASLKTILELLPEDKILAAVFAQDGIGETVIQKAIYNPESLKTILVLLPEDKRLAAVCEKNQYGETVIHKAAKYPDSLKTIYELVPQAAININETDRSQMNNMINRPEQPAGESIKPK